MANRVTTGNNFCRKWSDWAIFLRIILPGTKHGHLCTIGRHSARGSGSSPRRSPNERMQKWANQKWEQSWLYFWHQQDRLSMLPTTLMFSTDWEKGLFAFERRSPISGCSNLTVLLATPIWDSVSFWRCFPALSYFRRSPEKLPFFSED